MSAPRPAPSSGDVAMQVTNLSAGLGILTIPLFPLLLPGLVLVVAPLALVAMVGVLLAIPFILPLWLARIVLRRRSRRAHPATVAPPGS
jgi:ABC-type Na+ efflux pump permease subunit